MKSLCWRLVLLGWGIVWIASCTPLVSVPVTPRYLLNSAPESDQAKTARASDAATEAPGALAVPLNAHMDASVPLSITPSEKLIFSSYDPNGTSVYAPGWISKLDFSGVAMDNNRAATLIAPQFAVMAKHYHRPVGSVIHFHDRSGQVVPRTITGIKFPPPHPNPTFGNPDIALIRLDSPVPNSVRFYPVLPAGDYRTNLTGAKILALDAERKVHQFEIEKVFEGYNLSTLSARQAKIASINPAWYEDIIGGDSGKPSFLVIRGMLVLMSTHATGGWGFNGPFFGNADSQKFIVEGARALEQEAR